MSLATAHWRRRAASSAVAALLMVGFGSHTAFADGLGQTPPALSWIKLTDSRGIPLWNYELSVDRGGALSPGKVLWAGLTELAWGAYRSGVALALWFIDWCLSLSWLNKLAAPVIAVGDAVQATVNELGLVPVFLTVTALLAGLWFLRGRHTTAVFEIGAACTIAALASGVFSAPVQMVAGPDGYIASATTTGQQLAAQVSTGMGQGSTPEQLRAVQTGRLVDTFIRQPTQLINFGTLLDGTDCEQAYTRVVQDGPYGLDSDIRDAVADCDPDAGDYAGSPSVSMAMGALVFVPAALVVLSLAVVLGGSVIMAGMWAMFQSLKALVTLVTGLLPGGGRGSLLLTVTETVVSLAVIVFTSVFLSVFLTVIQAIFAAGGSPARTFVIVDVLLVAGLIIYRRQHNSIKAASHRMATWMGQRPGVGVTPTRIPAAEKIAVGAAALGAGRMWQQARQAKKLRSTVAAAGAGGGFADNRVQTVMVFAGAGPSSGPGATATAGPTGGPSGGGGAGVGSPAAGPRAPAGGGTVGGPAPAAPVGGKPAATPLPAGPTRRSIGAGPAPQPTAPSTAPSAAPQPRRRGKLARAGRALAAAGTSAALAAASGGTSVAARGAVKAAAVARTARRAKLTARMASAAVRSPQPPKPGTAIPVVPARVVARRPVTTAGPTPRTSLASDKPTGQPQHPPTHGKPPAPPIVPGSPIPAPTPRPAVTPRPAPAPQTPAAPPAAAPPSRKPPAETPTGQTRAGRLQARLAARSRTHRPTSRKSRP